MSLLNNDATAESARDIVPEILGPSGVSLIIQRPAGVGTFEFVVMATQRAGQLMRGCVPRVDGTDVHKPTIIAQFEVASGKVGRAPKEPVVPVVAALAPLAP